MQEIIKPVTNITGVAKKLKADGTSTRKVGRQKTLAALSWVYRWGWSYPLIVDGVASPQRRGFSKKLVGQKLLDAWPTESSGGIKGIPHTVLCLTRDGQAMVESELSLNQLLDQSLKDDIPRHQLRHDSLVQRATAKRIEIKEIQGFETPKEIASKSVAGNKQPDAIWILKNGQRMGLELELTRKKSGREINQTVDALLRAVEENNHHNLNMISILSSSEAILQDYQMRLAPGAKVRVWGKDNSGRPIEIPEKAFLVKSWAAGKFVFQKIEI